MINDSISGLILPPVKMNTYLPRYKKKCNVALTKTTTQNNPSKCGLRSYSIQLHHHSAAALMDAGLLPASRVAARAPGHTELSWSDAGTWSGGGGRGCSVSVGRGCLDWTEHLALMGGGDSAEYVQMLHGGPGIGGRWTRRFSLGRKGNGEVRWYEVKWGRMSWGEVG